jgi:ribosomal protein L19
MKNHLIKIIIVSFTFFQGLNSPSYALDKKLSGSGVVLSQGDFSIYEGKVSKINSKNRELTLTNVDGQTVYKAPPEMKNFQQVQVGDQVKVNLEVFVTVEKLSKSSAVRSKTLDSSQAYSPESSKPGKTLTRKTTIESQIISKIDDENYVVIKNINDEEEKIKINKASFFRQLKVGDTIKVSYQDQMKAIVWSNSPKGN